MTFKEYSIVLVTRKKILKTKTKHLLLIFRIQRTTAPYTVDNEASILSTVSDLQLILLAYAPVLQSHYQDGADHTL